VDETPHEVPDSEVGLRDVLELLVEIQRMITTDHP
jgi:hypothetical protein